MRRPAEPGGLAIAAAALVAAAALLALAPGIDLAVSAALHGPGGFVLSGSPVAEAVRDLLWQLSNLLMLAAVAGLFLAQVTGRDALWLPRRLWLFVLALYVIGPGLIVNLGLKAHWGRARPETVAEFGGTAAFTPVLTPASECARNCSFASGEVAAAAALALSALAILNHLRPRLTGAEYRGWLAAALAAVPLAMVLRVGAGRHFLSDAVFAVLIVAAVAVALDRLLSPPPVLRPRPGLDGRDARR